MVRFSAILAAALTPLIIAGTAYGWWLWRMQGWQTPLEPEWDAVVTVLAGDGVPGDRDGSASRARFSAPFGITATPDGSVWVADAGDAQAVRRVAPDGSVSTISADLNTPSGIAVGVDGAVYVADTGNHVVKQIVLDASGPRVTTVGTGVADYRDGPATEARFNGPIGVAVDSSGRVVVADTYNDRIRAIDVNGRVTTIAGDGQPGWIDGPATAARFDTPCGVAIDSGGTVYVADTGNDAVRQISANGQVTTVGPLPSEGLFRPIGIASTPDGVLYVTDDRGRIHEIRPGVRARTIAGSRPGFADGRGAGARFRGPAGVAVVVPGRLVVADMRNALVRLVTARSQAEIRAPASPFIDPSFDVDSFNLLPLMWPFEQMEGPYEITGTLGEARGGEGTERFHAGLDISGDEGMSVFAVRDGIVESPVALNAFDALTESIRVGPITYVHLRVGRVSRRTVMESPAFLATRDDTGRVVKMRVRRGTRFRTGERIGSLNAFNHAHINIGWPVEEHNPLRFRLVHFEDTLPPTISPFGIRLFAEDGTPIIHRDRGRLVVGGRVKVVVDAWDQVDGNEPRRRLGLHSLGYQVLQANRMPVPGFEEPRMTMVFDQFSADGEDAPGLVFDSGSGIPFYGSRRTRFLYVVTNAFRNGVATPGFWDSSTLPPGDYILRIIARDIRGNEAIRNRDVPVTIQPVAGSL